MKYVLTHIPNGPTDLDQQVEKHLKSQLQISIHHEVTVELDDPTKYLLVEVVGNKETHNNLFQVLIGFLLIGHDDVWKGRERTWQNLGSIVVEHFNEIMEHRLSDFARVYAFGNILCRYEPYKGCCAVGNYVELQRRFLEDFKNDPNVAGRELVHLTAYVFNINILVMDKTNGVELVQPWIPKAATRTTKISLTVCLVYQSIPGTLNGDFHILKKIK